MNPSAASMAGIEDSALISALGPLDSRFRGNDERQAFSRRKSFATSATFFPGKANSVLCLFESALRMPLQDFADIFVQITVKLGSISFKTRVVRAQKKFDAAVVLDDFQEIVCAE
jgi:hypothetical protein